MSDYSSRSIVDPVIEFIKTCPFLDEYNIDLDDISVQQITKNLPQGSAIDYVGSVQISEAKDINNRGFSKRQANFNLWLLRKSGHDFYRREIADFIWNFEQWVEYCQFNRSTPKISLDDDDKYDEIMFADNGVYFSQWEDGDSSLYMIQLHIIYNNRY